MAAETGIESLAGEQEQVQDISCTISPLSDLQVAEILMDTKLHICYRGTSHSGYSLSVIKSALQKGCRRNDAGLTAWAIREAYIYCHVGLHRYTQVEHRYTQVDDYFIQNKRKAAKSFNTNVINRLKVISVEDISPRNLLAANECHRQLEMYSDNEHPGHLMSAALKLVYASSSRVCSHLRALCGYNGEYYEHFSKLEKNESVTSEERLNHIFVLLNCDVDKSHSSSHWLMRFRSVVAYHVIQYYTAKVARYGNKITAAVKRREFILFWENCTNFIRGKSVNKYEAELLYAIKWRMEFFNSKRHFQEELLLMISAIELMIAVIFGDLKQFEKIQTAALDTPTTATNNKEGEFDWGVYHFAPKPIPPWVLDKHTSENRKNVSFAMESSAVIAGDDDWSPVLWLVNYIRRRLDNNDTPTVNYLKMLEVAKEALLEEVAASYCVVDSLSDTRCLLVPSHIQRRNKRKTELEEVNKLKKAKLETETESSSSSSPSSLHSRSQATKKASLDAIDINELPVIHSTDIEKVLLVHNPKSSKGVVATLLMADQTRVLIKEMRKSFGWGSHQNFVQALKDKKVCNFKHLLPCPGSGIHRGLFKADFEIKKIIGPNNVSIEYSPSTKCYFFTGCVTQNGGTTTETRLSKFNHEGKVIDYRQLIEILLFRMLLGVSDTNHSNILVGENQELYSVDENFIGSVDIKTIKHSSKYNHLRKLLCQFKLQSASQPAYTFPTWLTEEDERSKIMMDISKIGKEMGIGDNTLNRIEQNSKHLYTEFCNFFKQ